MASMKSNENQVCPMCFESPVVLKIVGTCKHFFCKQCLSSHLKSQNSASKVFSCPTCRVDCHIPGKGVDGLVDYTAIIGIEVSAPRPDQIAADTDSVMVRQDPRYTEGNANQGHKEIFKCKICFHRKNVVEALNICEECDIYLCKGCTQSHHEIKATCYHFVTSISSMSSHCCKKACLCVEHQMLLKCYCCTCSKAICQVCVQLEHGDHDVKKIEEFCSQLHDVKATVECRKTGLNELKYIEKELKCLKSAAFQKQDALIQEIETHAESCIEKIIKQKELLKKKVASDFKAILDMTATLDRIPEIVKEMHESVTKANELLLEVDMYPTDIDKLTSIKLGLEASGQLAEEIDREAHWMPFHELCQNIPIFTPETPDFNIGILEKMEQSSFDPKLIFEKRYEVNDEGDYYIPNVANLRKDFFAVAHPTDDDKPTIIDIYKFPGTLLKTTDHVLPLVDMAATPEGTLAVLSDMAGVGGEDTYCVQIFDPEKGYIGSTSEFVVHEPIAMGVNLRHQYMILSDNEERQKQITVVSEAGAVEQTLLLDVQSDKSNEIFEPSWIECGGRYTFLVADSAIAVYKFRGADLVFDSMVDWSDMSDVYVPVECIDFVSATIEDELYGIDTHYGYLIKLKYTVVDDSLVWSRDYQEVSTIPMENEEFNVSSRNGYFVGAEDNTLKVFSL